MRKPLLREKKWTTPLLWKIYHFRKFLVFLHFRQPRTQALSSTLLAGGKTLAGAGHVNTQILGGKLKSTEGGGGGRGAVINFSKFYTDFGKIYIVNLKLFQLLSFEHIVYKHHCKWYCYHITDIKY